MAPWIDTSPSSARASVREDQHALLEEARERTLWLVDQVSERDMDRVHDPLMSPLAWDLGHIAAFEDLWLRVHAGALEPLRADLMEVYDAMETPRARRGDLPFLRARDVRAYLAEVREQSLEADSGEFLLELVLQHEQQHNETMLQTLALAPPGTFAPERRPLPEPPAEQPIGMVRVPGGPFAVGDDGQGFAYDNERPRHEVDLPGFEIDRLPVTNLDYLAFVEDGGYARRELWTAQGWEWRETAGVERPLHWTPDGAVRSFELTRPLDLREPVMHVSWFEADAYARWAGKRLPRELEWEKAASWDPEAERKRRYPWGDEPPGPEHANLDQLGFGPAPAGAYPAGASPYGVLGLIGDVWEWTADSFQGYPGFRAYPYEEYSSVFFGHTHRALRGGSWATRPRVARCTFRNWDFPERRQIFSGFRCARDA